MRFLIGQAMLAVGVGVMYALIRYYTTYWAWKYIKGRIRPNRKANDTR